MLPAWTLVSTLALGAPSLAPLAGLSLGTSTLSSPVRPDLAVHAADAAGPPSPRLTSGDGSRRGVAASGVPVCTLDVCQPIVALPGYAPAYSSRSAREEAFIALLTRTHVTPLETVGWALAASGLRFEYAPPIFDGGGGVPARGWGSVAVRVRLRLDAHNGVVVPERPR